MRIGEIFCINRQAGLETKMRDHFYKCQDIFALKVHDEIKIHGRSLDLMKIHGESACDEILDFSSVKLNEKFFVRNHRSIL